MEVKLAVFTVHALFVQIVVKVFEADLLAFVDGGMYCIDVVIQALIDGFGPVRHKHLALELFRLMVAREGGQLFMSSSLFLCMMKRELCMASTSSFSSGSSTLREAIK